MPGQTSKAAFRDRVAKWNTVFERVILLRGQTPKIFLASWPDMDQG